jgi:hypothetical protein
MQLQREARAHLLQVGATAIGEELVAVVAEEDEVALVVEGHHLAAVEVGVLREEGRQHTADTLAGHRVEVVQDHLGRVIMAGGAAVVGDVVAEFDGGYAEGGGGSLGQVRDNEGVWGAVLLVPKQEVGVLALNCPLDDVLNLEVLPLVILDLGNGLLDFLQELEQVALRSAIGGHKYLRRCQILEITAELIDLLLALDVLILCLDKCLISHTHALYRVRFPLGHGLLALLLADFLLLQPFNHSLLLLVDSLPFYDL